MKIAIDAMGGDYAPRPNIDGAIAALDSGRSENIFKKDLEIVLVGKKELIKKELVSCGASGLPIEICDASQIIDMD
ncbi:phosphate acyltransferase PlsX, partial [Elusimicrobiota bacterium]